MAKLKPNQFYLYGHLITERPILFQTEMVQANLEDRKTQTRRGKGLEYLNINDPSLWLFDIKLINRFFFKHVNYPDQSGLDFFCPYGKPGDLLWARETWAVFPEGIRYKTEARCDPYGWEVTMTEMGIRWNPSIHMPKSAARLWLMVEDIRVERLQDISEADAKAEGIEFKFIQLFQEVRYRCYSSANKIPYQGFPRHWASNWREAISSFLSLWESINGKKSRDSNPWVWVVQYRILSKTGRPSDDTILENYLQITGKEKEVSHE
ncbi:hypothetical protein [Cyclobacterium jeungdonense]|uniref:Uncharacterized protein n=1 Tax=Cyclobacterium jeungdonense TaxID=708087 RepID=A0ABT8CAS4_9BACT|nr:hypothetical protein [Cyclobacterium jeungdonense]MDN3689069.1 hypothetical protein [Cyclobacterium jeungdonense]